MKTKAIAIFLALSAMLLVLTGCGEKKTLHCDRCNTAVEVEADSNMTEEWILFCAKCAKETGVDTLS